jgi:hypothetical protein
MVLARESRLMDIHGVGAVVAARILADVGDVARFADRNRFASWTGTAPLDASSGEQSRHRLSRAGNRRVNQMIHIAAVTQLRLDHEGRAYYRRKRAAGKKPQEALRCLKRRISDAIYKQLVKDAVRVGGADPGGHCGASQESSAVDLPPRIDTSDQLLPDPQTRRYAAPPSTRKEPGGRNLREHWLTTEGSRTDAPRALAEVKFDRGRAKPATGDDLERCLAVAQFEPALQGHDDGRLPPCLVRVAGLDLLAQHQRAACVRPQMSRMSSVSRRACSSNCRPTGP